MTVGSPTKRILNFTAPIFIGNIFQQFYSMADTIIVGKFVGNAALAAVGACGTLMFLILGFLQGMTAGFYSGDSTALWSGQSEGDAPFGGVSCRAFSRRVGGADGSQHGNDGADPALDEYAGRYVWPGIRIYYGDLCRYRGTGAVQSAGQYLKSHRRQ